VFVDVIQISPFTGFGVQRKNGQVKRLVRNSAIEI
jgi:hypothetical protein